MIAIINYNCGNIGSVKKMLDKLGAASIVTNNPAEIAQAKKIILPGVGAFDTGINYIKNLNIFDVLNESVLIKKKPVLGICLGMQLMTQKSEEGSLNGLCWIDAEVKKFPQGNNIRVPKIGWDYIQIKQSNALFNHLEINPRFYFVHSYYVINNETNSIVAESEYHHIKYTSAFKKDHIYGVQFHPEKSHKFGMQLLKNFANL